MTPRVDRNALRFNQGSIIILLAVGFAIGAAAGQWVILGVAAVMLLGTVAPPLALFKRVYRHLIVPTRLLTPDVAIEDPVPHQFAQALGGGFLIAAFVALAAGLTPLGWALAALVVALAAVNLVFGFCLGCFFYFQLDRLGMAPPLPGA